MTDEQPTREALRPPLVWYPRLDLLMPAEADREPSIIFVYESDQDVFEMKRKQLDEVFAMMIRCPRHEFRIETKYPDKARAYMRKATAQQWMWAWNRVQHRHRMDAVVVNGDDAVDEIFRDDPCRHIGVIDARRQLKFG